jgi:hypothetical protein
MPTLKQIFQQASKRRDQLRSAAEASAARTEWATFRRHSLEPFYFERHEFGRGRVVPAPGASPAARASLYEHVFDASGRLCMERAHGEREGFCTETFLEQGDGETIEIHFGDDPTNPVANVARYRFDGPRVVELSRRFKSGVERTLRFTWEADRLVRVVSDDPVTQRVDELSYDKEGRLVRIEWVQPNGRRSDVYRRVTDPLGELLAEVERALESAVESRLASLELDAPVAAVALWLDMAVTQGVLPPGLAVLPEPERAAMLAAHPRDPRAFAWNPVEWSLFEDDSLELGSPELLDAATRANHVLLQKSRFDAARKQIDRLCKRLSKSDLGALLPVTDDCVVFCVDITAGDGESGAQRAAPAAKRRALVKRGLLDASPRR